MNTFTLDIRDRRQATFPSALLKLLGINIGDSIEITVNKNLTVLKPKKQIAMEAFAELQRAFQESGITEEEMMKSVNAQRLADAQKINKWAD